MTTRRPDDPAHYADVLEALARLGEGQEPTTITLGACDVAALRAGAAALRQLVEKGQ